MQTITLESKKRAPVSRGSLNSLRKSGWLPAVVYGGHGKTKKDKLGSVMIQLNEKSFLKLIQGGGKSNVIFEIKMEGETASTLIKEIQRDAVSRKLLHVDFQRIVMTETIELMVPVHLSGEAPGVKLSGGILEHITREVKVSCLPKDIPQELKVDISQLNIGQSIHLKDVPALPGVTLLSDLNLLVANVVAPTILEEAPAAVAAAPAEPEVIAKGKKPEEGEAAAPAAGAKGQEKAPAAAAKPGTPGK